MEFTKPDNNVAQLELKGTEHIAVFGSGAGGHSFAALRALRGNGKVVALDSRQDLLDRVASDASQLRISGLSTRQANLEMIGGTRMVENSQDAVIIPNTLFSAGRKDQLLTEALRILKPEGKCLIIDWKESYGGMGPQPEHVVTEEQAKELAEAAGFEFVRSFVAGAQHYGLLYKKPIPRRR
jgi:ubiquinone/menaquinone biosynthesis C-methylase UbiE